MKLFSQKQNVTIHITNETIARTIVIVFLALLGLHFIDKVSHQLTLIGVSAFLALALNPAVTYITHRLKSKSRVRATGFAYLVVLTALIGFLSLVIPPLIRQTADFARDLPQTVDEFRSQDSALARAVRRYNLDDKLNEISSDVSNNLDNLADPALNAAGRIGGVVISIITVFVLTFMMLVEGPLWVKRFLAIQPAEKRDKRQRVVQRMYRVVTGYVNGQVLIAAIAAGFASVALLVGSNIANVSINAIALAGIVFIFGLIPLIGNTIGAILVVLVSLFSSIGLAIGMAIYFIIYQQVENATLQPYIQSRTNQLTPLIIFVAALIGVGLGGLLGALAAIPVAGCIRVVLDEYYFDRFPSLKTAREEVDKPS